MTRTGKKKRRRRFAAYAQCECGEYDPSAFIKTGKGNRICRNCNAKPNTQKGLCLVCLRFHPIERDHPLGWRVSDFTMALCLNCHAKKSAATTHITNAMARALNSECEEERSMLKATYGLIEFDYLSLVCRNILQRIGYSFQPSNLDGCDGGENKPEVRGAASSLLHGS
jgi:hypothetical protein